MVHTYTPKYDSRDKHLIDFFSGFNMWSFDCRRSDHAWVIKINRIFLNAVKVRRIPAVDNELLTELEQAGFFIDGSLKLEAGFKIIRAIYTWCKYMGFHRAPTFGNLFSKLCMTINNTTETKTPMCENPTEQVATKIEVVVEKPVPLEMKYMTNETINRLIAICKPRQAHLKQMLYEEMKFKMGRKVKWKDGFLYSPGSHPVLLVAHMDTVHMHNGGKKPTNIYIDLEDKDSPNGDLWCEEGIGGDDRCGVFLVMELIKRLDCHVLFTEEEEHGAIGAHNFCKSQIKPNVQFIVEFDRRNGNDAVFYDCDSKEFCDFVESYKFKKTFGTFSDISIIAPHLGIAAVNLSSAYYNPHTVNEYIRIHELDRIIDQAIPLISDVSQKFEYVKKTYTYTTYNGHNTYYGHHDTWDDSRWDQGVSGTWGSGGHVKYQDKKKEEKKSDGRTAFAAGWEYRETGTTSGTEATSYDSDGRVVDRLGRCDWCSHWFKKDDITPFTLEGREERFCVWCVSYDEQLKAYIRGCKELDGVDASLDDTVLDSYDDVPTDRYCANCCSYLSETGFGNCHLCNIDRRRYQKWLKEQALKEGSEEYWIQMEEKAQQKLIGHTYGPAILPILPPVKPSVPTEDEWREALAEAYALKRQESRI